MAQDMQPSGCAPVCEPVAAPQQSRGADSSGRRWPHPVGTTLVGKVSQRFPLRGGAGALPACPPHGLSITPLGTECGLSKRLLDELNPRERQRNGTSTAANLHGSFVLSCVSVQGESHSEKQGALRERKERPRPASAQAPSARPAESEVASLQLREKDAQILQVCAPRLPCHPGCALPCTMGNVPPDHGQGHSQPRSPHSQCAGPPPCCGTDLCPRSALSPSTSVSCLSLDVTPPGTSCRGNHSICPSVYGLFQAA